MTQDPGFEIPTAEVADEVVGDVGEASIEALRADGTTWHGTVVIAIRVAKENGDLTDTYRGCFRYDFRHELDDGVPHELGTCPAGPTLELSPAPTPAVDAAAVVQALNRLAPSQRVQVAAVRQALESTLGTGYVVDVESPTPTSANGADVFVSIRTVPPVACLAVVIDGHGTVTLTPPGRPTDCRGG